MNRELEKKLTFISLPQGMSCQRKLASSGEAELDASFRWHDILSRVLRIPAFAGMTLLIASSFLSSAHAEEALGIAAIVNDDVISTADLEERTSLAIGMSGKPDSPEVRKQARPQIIQMLVDESLKLQEAKRFNIMVESSDVDDAIARIEQSRQKPRHSMEAFIKEKGLSVDSLRNQIKGDVAWNKLIARKIRRSVNVSDEEIYRGQQRLAQGTKIKEVQIASINLPFSDKMNEEDTLGLARDIRSQLLAGSDGPELVKKYRDRIPLEFGPMTWAPREQLQPDIAKAIENLKTGEIAEPVRSSNGYQLIRLLEERTTSSVPEVNAEVAIKQIVLKLSEESMAQEIDAMMDIARNIAKYPGSCTEKGIAGMQDFAGLNIEANYIRTTLANLSPDVRHLLEPLKLTQITEPFAAPDGIHLLMLCERIAMPSKLPDRDAVKDALTQEKMDLEVEKYLRTMRREAYIDVRV